MARRVGAHLAANSACDATLFSAFALLLDLCGGNVGCGEGARSLGGSLWRRDGSLWLALRLGDHGGGGVRAEEGRGGVGWGVGVGRRS